jgi:hypothetical protein
MKLDGCQFTGEADHLPSWEAVILYAVNASLTPSPKS